MPDLDTPVSLTLDPATYPHIIDSIFRFADAASLINLRTACCAWRERADTALAAHLIVDATGPVYACRRGVRVRHPAFRTFPEPDSAGSWAAIAKCTKYVDWLGPRRRSETPAAFFEHPKEVVRMWESTTWPKRSMTELELYNDPDCVTDTIAVFAWPSNGHSYTDTSGCDLPFIDPTTEGTRKLVINYSVLQVEPLREDSACGTTPWLEECHPLDEIVAVFHASEPSTPGAEPTFLGDRDQTLPYRLNYLLEAAIFSQLGGAPKFTFVNFTAVPPALVSQVADDQMDDRFPLAANALRSGSSFQEYANVLFEESKEFYAELVSNEPVEVDKEWVEFLSLDEYEARVGPERFRYETMERPWEE
jgi:hypothetical protein